MRNIILILLMLISTSAFAEGGKNIYARAKSLMEMDEARSLTMMAAQLGYPPAMEALSREPIKDRFIWLERAAYAGQVNALIALAKASKSPEEEHSHLLHAASLGSREAMVLLFQTAKTDSEKTRWLEHALSPGEHVAEAYFALANYNPDTFDLHKSTMINAITQQAQIDPEACLMLAVIYTIGITTEPDYHKAKKWLNCEALRNDQSLTRP